MSPSPPGAVEVAVLGDLHGDFDLACDLPLLAPHAVRTCTGDLTPNGGRDRFDVALRVAAELAQARVLTILGNHDGPTCFTGRSFPKSYFALVEALGDAHASARRVEFPDLDLTIVGGRPLTCGGSDLRFKPPGREAWTLQEWGEEIAGLACAAEGRRIVILAHDGATGLGSSPSDIFGCDFRPEAGDWGDADLRLALDRLRAAGRPVVAVIAGHMHHALRGGGARTPAVREHGVLHLNAALVPRVTPDGWRALFVVRIEDSSATARLEWHGPGGERRTSAIEPLVLR